MIFNRHAWFRKICPIIMLLAMVLMPLAGVGAPAAQAAEGLQMSPINPDFLEFWQGPPPEPFYGYIPPPMDLSHLDEIPVERGSGFATLPSSFDWRDTGKVTSVKDQNPCGTCWCFGTTSAIESKVLIEESVEYDFSEQNLACCNDPSWVFLVGNRCMAGGNSFLVHNTLSKKGTRLESCDPYNTSTIDTEACDDSCQTIKRITDYRMVANPATSPDVIEPIKNAIYNSGPVSMAFYAEGDPWPHMYPGHIYYYPSCTENSNHIVSIVGWDDTIAHPAGGGSGAWIVKNSWGTVWGDSGYFYLCYGSASMREVASFYYKDYDANEQVYYWDEAGQVDASGCGAEFAWMANIFTSEQDGSLTHVDFWTTSNNAEYEIYVYLDGDISDGLDNLATSQSGTCEEFGYYSIPLSSPVSLTNGQPFTIAVKMTTPGFNYPLPVECQVSSEGETMVDPPIQSGVSYARCEDTGAWDDFAGYGCNACLRGKVSTGGAGEPDITVSPTSFEKTLAPDTSQDYTLSVGNVGDATLSYTITDEDTTAPTAPGGVETPSLPSGPSRGREGLIQLSPSQAVSFPTPPATGVEIYYDDGEADDAYWWGDAGDGFAVRFTPPEYPVNLMIALFCFWPDAPDGDHEEFAVEVYDDDGTGGAPGTLLGGGSLTASDWGWCDVDISSLGITITSGDFYIAYVQLSDEPDCEALCVDSTDPVGRSWDYWWGEWEPWEYDNYMIRCVVEGGGGGNNPPNTPSGPSPANHATGVSVAADLSWSGGDPDPGDTVTYDVYFDTTGGTTLVSNDQSACSYDPGTLSVDAKYYWKIVATDNHAASTSGPVWDLTTGGGGEDCSWLSETPASGSVAPGEPADSITVTIDTTGLAVGDYSANIVIANNDPDENPKTVPVTLHVSGGGGEPDITVSPTSLEKTLAPDTSQGYTLSIGNVGDATLTYTISDEEAPGQGSGSAPPPASLPSPSVLPGHQEGDVPEQIFEEGDNLEELRDKIEQNGYNFTVEHNWVYDMSPEEKEKFFSRGDRGLFEGIDASEDIGPLAEHLGRKQLPSQFDWRNYEGHSYIGDIGNQGACGSCYAFGACAAAEGTYNFATGLYDGNCKDFSESFIMWCLGNLPEYNSHFYGCDGADYTYSELTALTVEGVSNEADFPYQTTDGCGDHWDDPRITFDSWYRIPCGDIEAIKTAIMTYGVVDAAVYVTTAFEAYSSGIYEDSNTACDGDPCYYTTTNHAIALVGWDDNGDAETNGYWILRNSWGSSGWGENGYMRIKYRSAVVACEACYLVYSGGEGCSWLSESPASGSVAPGEPVDSITVTIDTTGLAVGDYSAEIVIANNDPDENPKTVPVTLHVSGGGGEPDITVSPTSLEKTLAPDTSQGYTLSIGNVGDATLSYTITDEDTTAPTAPAGAETPTPSPSQMEGDEADAQAVEMLQVAPLNPDFLEFQEKPPEPFYGYIPPTMDLSHLDEIPVERAGGFATLPGSFDWRDTGKVTLIKNQNPCGTCWVHGTVAALESRVLIVESTTYDFSEQNLICCTDPAWVYLIGNRCMGGGPAPLAADTMTKKGSRLESCDPYNTAIIDSEACDDSCETIKLVTDFRMIANNATSEEVIEPIKDAIYYHGPLAMNYAADDGTHMYPGSIYYWPSCPASEVNHLVCIIGWDDTIAHPAGGGSGAWIVKNSWGTDWADSGYFYLCYGSAGMCEIASFDYKDYDSNETVYYWDEAGGAGATGCGTESAWMANIFNSTQDGSLTHVDFWTTSNNAEYEIYVYLDGDISDGLDDLATSRTGTCEELGYYSMPLTSPVSLTSGQAFTIAVKMTTPGYNYPIAAEYELSYEGEIYCDPPIQSGVSYARCGGTAAWEDLGEYGCNVCLRGRVTTGGGGEGCSWLDESPTSGSVEPSDSDSITVTIDTTGLTEGDYSAEIVIANNDPDENPKTVPVTLHVGSAGGETTVDISPSCQAVSIGEAFTVDVTVDPAEAIAGMQFDLSFDSSLVTVDSVTEGNLLDQGGASTYFSAGTINNTVGTVTGVAGAITTPGATVSLPGTFATISLTAGATEGTSTLDLLNVIVGDIEGSPVEITVNGGSVIIEECEPWDVNCDQEVNVLDMIRVGQHWEETGTPGWIREDVNDDGEVNVLDMIVIGQHWTG